MRHGREVHGNTEAEFGVCFQKRWNTWSHQKLKETRVIPNLAAFEKLWPSQPLDFEFLVCRT